MPQEPQETNSQRERRIGYAELSATFKSLTAIAHKHDTEIELIKAQIHHLENRSENFDDLINGVRDGFSDLRVSVEKSTGSVNMTISQHIISDEKAIKRALIWIISTFAANIVAIVGFFGWQWIKSGMPWPIFVL